MFNVGMDNSQSGAVHVNNVHQHTTHELVRVSVIRVKQDLNQTLNKLSVFHVRLVTFHLIKACVNSVQTERFPQ